MRTPVVGRLYTCREMSEMHGGSFAPLLPDKGGRITLIRTGPDWNPDGPEVIEYGPPHTERYRGRERIEMLKGQTGEHLPVYVFSGTFTEWEYRGPYRVVEVTSGAGATAERSGATGRPVDYVIRLQRGEGPNPGERR